MGTGTSRTGTGQPPRFGPNARANAEQELAGRLGRSETTVAATEGGQRIVVGFNDAQGFCGPPFGVACTPQTPPGLSGYAYSSDGGLTWTDGGAPDPALSDNVSDVFTRGDPWLDRGGFDQQTFYYANLAVHATTGATLGVSVHRGHFLGGLFTWMDVRTFDSPHNNTLCTNPAPPGDQIPCDFYDKEALAAAKDGSGTAYVSLTNFLGQKFIGPPPGCGTLAQFGFGQIEVWRTHDGGATWQGPAIAGPETADSVAACGDTGTLQQSSAPAIGPDGEAYVAWQRGPTFTPATGTSAEIVIARSLDGGVTFDAPVVVAAINSMRQNPPVGYNRDRINDHPRTAVATTGRFRGRVYVVYYDALAPVVAAATAPCPAPLTGSCRPQTLTSSQVFLKYSDDQGLTWSAPVPLAPAPPSDGVKRFWPVVSVEPGGNVDVAYYESREEETGTSCTVTVVAAPVRRRHGPASSLVDTYWTQSLDGGMSFKPPMKISTATSNWCTATFGIRPNFGDYIGAVAGGNRFLVTWADSRNTPVDTFVTHILGGQSGR